MTDEATVTVKAAKEKPELTEKQLAEQAAEKKMLKKTYTSGYWDAVRGVRSEFGEGSKIGDVYEKGHVAGTKALAEGKTGWKPKRAPKVLPGRVILGAAPAATSTEDLIAAESVLVADPEAQARVLAEEADLGLPVDPAYQTHGVDDDNTTATILFNGVESMNGSVLTGATDR